MTVKVSTPPGVHLIQTPTVYPGIPTVNSYLIEGPLTLVDGGLNTAEAWKSFNEQVDLLGFRVADIRRILVTHGHPDHYGLAEKIRQISNATVFIGETEAPKVIVNTASRMESMQGTYGEFCRRLAVPDSVFQVMRMMGEMNHKISPPVQSVTTVRHGDRIPFDRFELEVIATPGHTLGIVCYHEPVSGFVFSSDHLLEETSPNPVIELGEAGEQDYDLKFRSLVSYLQEMEKLKAMDLSCILPGHGLPFRGHGEVIDSLFSFYARRQLKVWNVLRDSGPLSVHALGAKVFPNVAGMQGFLVACELLGNLEVMEESSSVVRGFDGTHYLYEAAPEPPRIWPFR